MIEGSICRSIIFGEISSARGLILESGIDVNAKLSCNVRPLTLALKLRSREAIFMLLSLGADVELPDKIDDSSMLYDAYWEASEFEEPRELGLLLDGGLPINRLDKEGLTLLMHAAFSYVWTTKFLLERGADPNIRDRDGWTSLMYAAQTDRHTLLTKEAIVEVVKLLIAYGADMNLTNAKGERAVDILAKQEYVPRKTLELKQIMGLAEV